MENDFICVDCCCIDNPRKQYFMIYPAAMKDIEIVIKQYKNLIGKCIAGIRILDIRVPEYFK